MMDEATREAAARAGRAAYSPDGTEERWAELSDLTLTTWHRVVEAIAAELGHPPRPPENAVVVNGDDLPDVEGVYIVDNPLRLHVKFSNGGVVHTRLDSRADAERRAWRWIAAGIAVLRTVDEERREQDEADQRRRAVELRAETLYEQWHEKHPLDTNLTWHQLTSAARAGWMAAAERELDA